MNNYTVLLTNTLFKLIPVILSFSLLDLPLMNRNLAIYAMTPKCSILGSAKCLALRELGGSTPKYLPAFIAICILSIL
jgi:hypothetical protein